MSKVPTIPVLRGAVDLLEPRGGGQARLGGWIFYPDTAIERIDITLQGKPWTLCNSFHERSDIKAAFDSLIGPCPHSLSTGFDVTAVLPEGVDIDSNTLVGITPYTPNGFRLDRYQTYLCAYQDELNNAPQPPVHLKERVGGSKDFVNMAAQIASLVMTYVGKYKPIFESGNILDWAADAAELSANS